MRVLVPHLFPSPAMLDAAADLHLPTLQTVLARGQRTPCPAAGVEAALCEALGIERQQDWPVAPITLEADGGAAGGAYWLRVDPVHLRVMRDRIVLAPELPVLAPDEAQALAASIGAHFGDAPHPLAPQRWYLSFTQAPALTTTPRALAAGRDIQPLLPQGGDAVRVRAWLNEVQMLLHDHPVNLAREARGILPVNALWPWGGGIRPTVRPQALRIACEAPEQRAIAHFTGALRVAPDDPHAALVVVDTLAGPVQAGDLSGWRDALRQFDAQLANLLHAHAQLSVIDPVRGLACHARRLDRWKFWHRLPPLDAALRCDHADR
jgi:hypothetical protein